MSLTDQLVTLLRAEFGNAFIDLRSTLPRHNKLVPERYNVARTAGISIHHPAAETSWRGVAEYHVWGVDKRRNKGEWPVIAYGVGVQNGKVYLLRNIEEMGYHTWGRNEDLLSICVMGDLTLRDPSQVDVLLTTRVIRVYDRLLKRQVPVRGHSGWALPGHNTTCPGNLLRGLAPTLRSLAPAPVVVPVTPLPPVRYDKVAWGVEEGARLLKAEGLTREHDYIVETVLPPIIKLRG